jgi:hypothetical protein
MWASTTQRQSTRHKENYNETENLDPNYMAEDFL